MLSKLSTFFSSSQFEDKETSFKKGIERMFSYT